jgi:hypothetical protein
MPDGVVGDAEAYSPRPYADYHGGCRLLLDALAEALRSSGSKVVPVDVKGLGTHRIPRPAILSFRTERPSALPS